MLTKLTTLCSILVSTAVVGCGGEDETTAPVESGWDIVDSGVNTGLNDVYFVDRFTGWAVGDSGVIVHTTSGASSWLIQESGTFEVLEAVHFVDRDCGWAVGHNGTILHTDDGGSSWSLQDSGTPQSLFAVEFLTGDTGWVVGQLGIILHTTDGGQTWTVQQDAAWTTYLTSIQFFGADSGLAFGAPQFPTYPEPSTVGSTLHDREFIAERVDSHTTGYLFQTVDRGETWDFVSIGPGLWPSQSFFIDMDHGWTVHQFHAARVFSTTDGGDHWIDNACGNGFDLHFINKNTGWVVGVGIFRTDDGGATWTTQHDKSYTNILRGVHFLDEENGWAVGANGIILRTVTGGV